MATPSGDDSAKITLPLPSKLVWLIAIVLLFALCATVGYAVWDNRTIDFWPPSIHAKDDVPASAKSSYVAIVDAMISGIDVPIIVYRSRQAASSPSQ